jgi:hypothetical protein
MKLIAMKPGLLVLGVLLMGCSASHQGAGNTSAAAGGSSSVTTDAGETSTVGSGGPVDIGGVFNARHVGTLAAGSKHLRDHILIRSGDLYDITEAGCATLGNLNLRTILDLRDEPNLSNRPDPSCGNAERSNVKVTLPKLLPPNVDNYNATLDATEPKLSALFTALVAANGPVLIHCVIGRDRATLTTALVLLALGVDEATVLADATTNQDPSVAVEATWFSGAITRIQGAGGIEPYLLQHGVTAAQLAELSSEMTE